MFRKCKSCPSGRVFYLKFSNDRRDFFWMQEHSSANDDEYARKLNDIIKGEQESGDAGVLWGRVGWWGGKELRV